MRSHIPYCMYISMDQHKGGLVTYFFLLSISILFMFERIIATRQTGVSEIWTYEVCEREWKWS